MGEIKSGSGGPGTTSSVPLKVAHKTLEGTRLQCEAAGAVSKIICSTLVEVHQVVAGGLVDEGLVDDVSVR